MLTTDQLGERRVNEERILVVAPLGRDAGLIAEMLSRASLHVDVCTNLEHFAGAVQEGAGAGVITEEALNPSGLRHLLAALHAQPAWSDVPLALLTSSGYGQSSSSSGELATLSERANLTVLERPVRVATLISTVRTALRARRRQLEIRHYLLEQQQYEEQLRQTQKLESLGVLAGGVAHDFNNLLTGVLGNASLALQTLTPHHPAVGMLQDVVGAAQRAADLTRQLLAYAGKGRFIVCPVDISKLVVEISNLIQTSIPKNVQLRLELADNLPAIQADTAQLQQLVMNLVINGAEAVAAGSHGTVLVTTYLQDAHVVLEVSDTGCGMDEATRTRIFDPFFTTKFTGRGLGLAAVQGIVRGHRGALKVDSAPGKGSTFQVFFPISAQEEHISEKVDSRVQKDVGGTVLVVDDEQIVRRTAKNMLELYGYTVILAENGQEALDIFRVVGDRVSIVLLDMTMPRLSGEETLRLLLGIRPNLKVILCSGYTEAEAIERFAGKGLAGFMQKPYSAEQLTAKIRSVLKVE